MWIIETKIKILSDEKKFWFSEIIIYFIVLHAPSILICY